MSSSPVESRPPVPGAQVKAWWRLLCGLAVVNVGLWFAVWQFLPGFDEYGAWQLQLSGVYVLVCAYRSLLPRIDLERRVIIDSRLSSIFLGRTAATVAEICFGIQLGLLVHQLGAQSGLPWVQSVAWTVPVFMVVAQAFCWHSTLTLNHITQAVESILWGAGFAWMAVLLGVVAFHGQGTAPLLAGAGVAIAVVFVGYVVLVDVPMYLRRYREGRVRGLQYLSLARGLRDTWERREPRHDWASWKGDALWLTPYFSAGVWLSLSLVVVARMAGGV